MCKFVPTVKSYLDITLDPQYSVVSAFVYNQSESDYVKTLLPNALVFVANLSNKESPTLCYAVTNNSGWLQFPYDPDVPGCTDYWFIFCPLSASANASDLDSLYARELCLNSTGLGHAGENGDDLITPFPAYCQGVNEYTPKNYQEHILSHNVLFFCNKVPRDYAPLCWPLMLILGLLLGASFAVGRNPFAAFDLSSPRLARGRQYSARVQNMSFDMLGYLMAAAQAGMGVKGAAKGGKAAGKEAKGSEGSKGVAGDPSVKATNGTPGKGTGFGNFMKNDFKATFGGGGGGSPNGKKGEKAGADGKQGVPSVGTNASTLQQQYVGGSGFNFAAVVRLVKMMVGATPAGDKRRKNRETIDKAFANGNTTAPSTIDGKLVTKKQMQQELISGKKAAIPVVQTSPMTKIEREKANSIARGTSKKQDASGAPVGTSRTEDKKAIQDRKNELKGKNADGTPVERNLTSAERKTIIRPMKESQRENRKPSDRSDQLIEAAKNTRDPQEAAIYRLVGLSFRGDNFGQAVVKLISILADLLLAKYGLSVKNIYDKDGGQGGNASGIFAKESWKHGFKPVVNTTMDLIKFLIAIYSITCEISNYAKSVKLASGKTDAKGFMDDVSENDLFSIKSYKVNTNALLSWLSPGMQGAGTGPGMVYPFSYLVAPVADGLKLSLNMILQSIDNAVTNKKAGKGENAPQKMAVSQDGNYGLVEGKDGVQYYKKILGPVPREMWEAYTPSPSFAPLPFSPDDIIKNGTVIYGATATEYAKGKLTFTPLGKKEKEKFIRNLQERNNMKMEALQYLVKDFGLFVGERKQTAIAAQMNVLKLQNDAIANPESSAFDLKFAQDLVERTRFLMNQVNAGDMMEQAGSQMYDNAAKEALKKKIAALDGEINSATPGSHAYVSAKAKKMELETVQSMCTMFEAMNVDPTGVRKAKKITQRLFMLELDATATFGTAYFQKDERSSRTSENGQKAIAGIFGKFMGDVKGFTSEEGLMAKGDIKGAKAFDQLEARLDNLEAKVADAKKTAGLILGNEGNTELQNRLAGQYIMLWDALNKKQSSDEVAKEKKAIAEADPKNEAKAKEAGRAERKAQEAAAGVAGAQVAYSSIIAGLTGDKVLIEEGVKLQKELEINPLGYKPDARMQEIAGLSTMPEKSQTQKPSDADSSVRKAQIYAFLAERILNAEKSHLNATGKVLDYQKSVSLPPRAFDKIMKAPEGAPPKAAENMEKKAIRAPPGTPAAFAGYQPISLSTDEGISLKLNSSAVKELAKEGHYEIKTSQGIFHIYSADVVDKKSEGSDKIEVKEIKLLIFKEAVPPVQPSPSEGPLKEAPVVAARAPPQETDAEKDAKAKQARIIANTERTLSGMKASESAALDREMAEKEQKERAKGAGQNELSPEQRFDYAQSMINYNIKYITLKGGSMTDETKEAAQAAIEGYRKKPTEENLQEVERTAGAFKFMSEYISDQKAKKSKSKGK